ncbi:V-type ATP synthase subunit B [Nocardia seriolae]|uniref:V-type ATP synthase beta chain n=1 Tax=Nocardia seriolae TaxID=37332 RepID=A0ABC9YZR9_9NOCA|nr:V-type ATP synthase subunit B [Nocardia seriolae]APA98431.1 V-type proton ATPase subunit B [Nocardia seriolae]OJF80318.1 V-type ATP synthase subunit B [Nocardia seriolae]PSK29151.1 V-type ATP synthase subunit B [Nocardia seriolae]QOW35733.1 V-type ATP synthase subunit B [Nocardia seriolae]QUN16776.1 V-type ATP synthase subunit B [Nocardia seriolae]
MTTAQWMRYTGIRDVHGPLLMVSGVRGAAWDELVRIELGDGPPRHGLVLDVDDDVAVVQVFEGTAAVDPAVAAVEFRGSPMEIPVGGNWLGRVCNGRGEPLDGGPPVTGPHRPIAGAPLNPMWRVPPAEPVLTGVSAIDVLATLVRGQKLPVFSAPGLPHLRLACQTAAQASSGGEPFCVVFAGMGLTHADAAYAREVLEERSAAGELVLLQNLADDPVIERILTPRMALTIAEELAFEGGRHVLVVLTDMTDYADALREISSARGELPGRRAYPGYLYSDLATLYERCGRIRDRPGSVTILPVLTMPGGDITHPVPDLTGYITEGQLVLSPEVAAHGAYPPMDVLSSLSRLMRAGAGPGRTRADHLPLAAQLLAALARARQARELAELIGTDGLTDLDRAHLAVDEAFRDTVLDQRTDEIRTLDESLDRAWRALDPLPAHALTMLPAELVAAHRPAPAVETDDRA